MIDHRPALIARCRTAADVRTAVKVARTEEMPVSVRGGGHGVAGTAVCDDGLMIDLSSMKDIQVDPAGRAKPSSLRGVLWGEFDQATAGSRIGDDGRGRHPTPASPGRRLAAVWLPHGKTWRSLRQSAFCRHRHRRWGTAQGQRGRKSGLVLGASRCRCQLWGRHVLPLQLGPYKIERILGAGGMGEVSRQWTRGSAAKSAIKVCVESSADVLNVRRGR